MIRAKTCNCDAFPFEHERYGDECVDYGASQDWPDDAKLDDPRRGQAKELNRQRYNVRGNDE